MSETTPKRSGTQKKKRGYIENYLRSLTFKRPLLTRLSAFLPFFPFVSECLNIIFKKIISILDDVIEFLDTSFEEKLDLIIDFLQKIITDSESNEALPNPVIT